MGKYLYALDLSMDCSGVVIFDLDSYEPLYITSIPTKEKLTHGKRLNQIFEGMTEITDKYLPTEIAIERGFSRFNTSTQVIYRVHGLINWLFKDYTQTYYPPKTVKLVVGGKGDISKKKLEEKINKKYPHINFSNDNESDAFAIGLTYLIKEHGMKWE